SFFDPGLPLGCFPLLRQANRLVAAFPLQDRRGEQVMSDLKPRSVRPAGGRLDRAPDTVIAASQPLKQDVGLIRGAANVLGEVGRCQSDLGSGWCHEMMEDSDSSLALFIRKASERPVDMGPDDCLGSAQVL